MTKEMDPHTQRMVRILVDQTRRMQGTRLKGGGYLRVHVNSYCSQLHVEIYRVRAMSQAILGYLGVVPPKNSEDCHSCTGVFYAYATEYGSSTQRIEINCLTAEEAIEKMAGCLAPYLEVESWFGTNFTG